MTSYDYTRGGGPAFPVNDSLGCVIYGGMTLRDYFAARAIDECMQVANDQSEDGDPLSEAFLKAAKYAYAMADVMLIVRDIPITTLAAPRAT